MAETDLSRVSGNGGGATAPLHGQTRRRLERVLAALEVDAELAMLVLVLVLLTKRSARRQKFSRGRRRFRRRRADNGCIRG